MLNRVTYQGRLTADIELQQTQSGVAYCSFTVAWNEKYKEVETKCFLRCKAWRQTAEFLSKYFRKGQEIIVEGKLNTEEWEQDGSKRSRTVLSVEKAHFCGTKADTGYSPRVTVPQETGLPSGGDFVSSQVSDDDLPF